MFLKAAKIVESTIITDIAARDWIPYRILSGNLFPGIGSIPSHLIHAVYASGNMFSTATYRSEVIPSGKLIGAAEIYRYGFGDPVRFNKDVYALVRLPSSGFMVYADGPFRDHEHWINEIPQRLNEAEIYIVSKSYT